MTDIASAIGIQQLKKLSSFLQRRQYLASRYFDLLKGLPLTLPSRAPNNSIHAWHLYVVRLTDDFHLSRDEVISKLSQLGIGTSVHYVPLHRQPYWRNTYKLSPSSFPATDHAYTKMISLPLYTKMTDFDQQRVVSALSQILQDV